MSKKGKIIIQFSAILIVILAGLSITRSINQGVVALKYCDTYFMNDNPNKFLWLFDNTKMSAIKCEYAIGNTAIEKYRFVYTYEDKYRYVIFGDSSINSVDLKNIKDSVDKNSFKIDAPLENNSMGWGGHFNYKSKMCIDSCNKLILSLAPNENIEKIATSNSIQFRGIFQEVAIQNEIFQFEYLIKFNNPTLTNIVFYKPKNILYIIVINSFENKVQDNEGINYLNLR